MSMGQRGASHSTSVRAMGTRLNPVYAAECSCGWESVNLRSHRRHASDDARQHRGDEKLARDLEREKVPPAPPLARAGQLTPRGPTISREAPDT